MKNLFRSLAVLAIVVGATASAAAQDIADPPSATIAKPLLPRASLDRAFEPQTLTKADWQRQYDLAIDRKNAGKRKLLIGLIAEGAGIVLLSTSYRTCTYEEALFLSTCNGSSALTTLGIASALGGGGLAIWGWIQYADGRGDMESLERRQPTGGSVADVGTGFRVSLGTRSTVAYRVSW